jgi:hypothetical protein
MNTKIKDAHRKKRKRRWDAFLVAFGMIIAFYLIFAKITGYWPCHIASALQFKQLSCNKSIQENMSSIINWFQQVFFPHFLLQSLQNI